MDDQLARYDRQMRLPGFGEHGQRQLLGATALIAGCGGLGSTAAALLARAGVGHLKIVDRDEIDITNLQRQILYDEKDVAELIVKPLAAKRRLATINSQVQVTAFTREITSTNAESLVDGCDVVVDGLDNFATRVQINDAIVKLGVPYVHGAAVVAAGSAYAILPHTSSGNSTPWEAAGVATPCLRCIYEQVPPREATPTCDTVGILGSIVSIIGSYQAAETIKILTGNWSAVNASMAQFDLWEGSFEQLDIRSAYDTGDCPCCKKRQFEFIESQA